MVAFPIEGSTLELPRNLALLDTNVLVALVSDGDQYHEDAQLFLDAQDDYVLAVSPPVIVEACGLLSKRPDRVQKLLQLILDPGSGIRLLPAPHNAEELHVQRYLQENSVWMGQYAVDYVDAFLMKMADVFTQQCGLSPFLAIVTTDLRDFSKCMGKGYSYGVYVLGSNEAFFSHP